MNGTIGITNSDLKEMINEVVKDLVNSNMVCEGPHDFTLETIADEPRISQYIKDNYRVRGTISIEGNVVNVDGNIKAKPNAKNFKGITDGTFRFGTVTGYFSASHQHLPSLEGAPEKVGRGFYIDGCSGLKNLIGSPKEVGGDYSCQGAWGLESLEGCTKVINGNFDCSQCLQLASINGGPEIVKKNYIISDCGRIKNLDGAPKEVGAIYCEQQDFSTLSGYSTKFSDEYILSKIKVDPDNIYNEFSVKRFYGPGSSLSSYSF